MLAVKLLFMCHFLINATNKVVAVHSMPGGKVYIYRKLPPTILAHFHGPFSSKQVLIRRYLASPLLNQVDEVLGSDTLLRVESCVLLHIQSFSVLEHPTYIYIYIYVCVCVCVCVCERTHQSLHHMILYHIKSLIQNYLINIMIK